MIEIFTDADPMRADDFRLPADGWRENKTAYRAQEGKVDIKRFDLVDCHNEGDHWSDMKQKQFGEYVRYRDVEAVISECEELRAKLAAMESQEPVGSVYGKDVYVPWKVDEPDWSYRYAKPVPADKPAVAVPLGFIDGPDINGSFKHLGWMRMERHKTFDCNTPVYLASTPSHSQQSDYLQIGHLQVKATPLFGFQTTDGPYYEPDYNPRTGVATIKLIHETTATGVVYGTKEEAWAVAEALKAVYQHALKANINRCPSHESEQ